MGSDPDTHVREADASEMVCRRGQRTRNASRAAAWLERRSTRVAGSHRPLTARKVIKRKARTLTPTEYVAIVASLPAQHRLMVETAINTGLRWGELIALKPRHLDLIKRTLTVEETVVEVSIKNSPTGARMLTKP